MTQNSPGFRFMPIGKKQFPDGYNLGLDGF